MRFFITAFAITTFSIAANADVLVDGHFKSDGTYVAPHYRSNPDGNRFNNWSTQGNVNPHTGEVGTKSPYSGYSYGSMGGFGNDLSPGKRRW